MQSILIWRRAGCTLKCNQSWFDVERGVYKNAINTDLTQNSGWLTSKAAYIKYRHSTVIFSLAIISRAPTTSLFSDNISPSLQGTESYGRVNCWREFLIIKAFYKRFAVTTRRSRVVTGCALFRRFGAKLNAKSNHVDEFGQFAREQA